MNLKKSLMSLGIASLITPQVFAYNIYNATGRGLNFIDNNPGGMETSIAVNSYASCNPKARGCYGNMEFRVYSSVGSQFLCAWSGKLAKGKGNYFLISPKSEPNTFGRCKIEYYHD